MATQQFVETLRVHDCPSCGVAYGLTRDFEARRRDDHATFYCPNGHTVTYRVTSEREKELQSLRASVEFNRQRAADHSREAEAARRSAAASRGVVTRIKKRIAKGVCPCCKRYFADVHRHIQGQHPEFQAEA